MPLQKTEQSTGHARCPCRKKSEATTYAECCEPFHRGSAVPPTAQALMRSRYSAFALLNAAYLLATWHPRTRPTRLDFTPGQQWVMLKLVSATTEGDHGTVEFVARSKVGGKLHELHEVSRFVRDGGRWYYVDGDIG